MDVQPDIKKVVDHKRSVKQYYASLDSIHHLRDSLGKAYRSAGSETKRKEILKKTKTVFLSGLQNVVFEQWYGTPWTFYGASDTPGTKSIACGYFVTTALRDMGVRLNRTALAECASETMIRKLIDKEYITPYRAKPVQEFVETVTSKGDELYIVGLDFHTGFLLCENGYAWFIHSFPPGVKKESPYRASYLADSKYRVTGCITADAGFFRRWVLQESL
jgi:hypothetical protein